MARLVFVLSLLSVAYSLTPSSYLTNVDQQRFRNLFQAAQPFTSDLHDLYYAVAGSDILGGGIEFSGEACKVLKAHTKIDDVENLFYSTSAQKILKAAKSAGDCAVKYDGAEAKLNEVINGDKSTKNLFYAASALNHLGKKVDAGKLTKSIDAALDSDESILSHAFAFYAVALLKGSKDLDLNKYHSLIEDMVAQADEIDDVMMRFEGGLLPTALLVDASYSLADAAKKAPTITNDQAIKFANYFLSRKFVQSLENSVVLLQALKTLSSNNYQVPIVVTLASQVAVNEKYPVVQVRVSNLFGQSLGSVGVTAETARHVADDAVVLSMKPFTVSKQDPTLYELDFLKNKAARGFYKFAISVASKEKNSKLIGGTGAEVTVKVTTNVAIENVEVGVGEKDSSSAIKTTKLSYPNSAKSVLEADQHQKVAILFTLVDQMTKQPMTTHQSFIRLTNVESGAEIIFVSESDNQDQYKFEMDVGANAKLFGQRSGKYSIELIVGDAVVQNPISWKLAEVQLSFADETKSKPSEDIYAKKPEIEHMFREPERRPPVMVSNLFTGLVLLPLFILFVVWMRIGVNISNFPLSPIALGFHIGLAGIFGLYYCYFTQLDMFTTLKYLGLVGGATFILGNRLLASIAAKRKQ